MTPLEREYSPSTRVASLAGEIERYRADSTRAAALGHEVLNYGPHPDEFAVVVNPRLMGHLHVFIHGGYWQELSAWDSLGPALGFADQPNTSFAAVNYSLAPAVDLPTIITQCRAALHMLQGHFVPTSVTLSGSSAGAHLAAHAAIAARLPLDLVVLLSGVYDLTPLVDTYVNDALGLSLVTAREYSVPFDVLPGAPVVVAHGDNETAAFIAQSAALAEAWDAELIEMPDRNHFDVVFDLALLDSPTRRAAARPAL